MDTACVDVCPVDCIHTTEGEKQLYINPDECIDCAACEPVCPVDAISMQSDVPSEWEPFIEINRKFFETFVKPETADAGADETGKTKQGKQQGIPEEFVQIPEVPDSSLRAPYNVLIMLLQPLLGAFSAKFKARLEEMAGNTLVFSSAVSTGINSLINLTLYPLILFFIGVKGQSANLFTSEGNLMIFLGIIIAISEGIYRFKDEFSSIAEQPRYGAAFYGWIPSLVATPILIGLRSVLVVAPKEGRLTVPGSVDPSGAVYADDVRERYRRYGMINRVTEMANHYQVEIEFPRWVPNSVVKEENDLPDRMPDYDYEINLSSPYMPGETPAPQSVLTVQTQLEDPRFASILGRTSSFPNGFTNTLPISGQPEDFHATYRNKVLTIVVSKSGSCEALGLEPAMHYAKLKG
jgi:NAD-dependent dihydropyrimidine dehydrogenase PreA subunit